MARYLGAEVIPPTHRVYDPDDSLDFHAARLLLLIRVCGDGNPPYIEGRTKLAKLDFFLRYPAFLGRALGALGFDNVDVNATPGEVEAPMIRYRFGPWDPRYRQFLAFLESRQLVSVTRSHKVERVKLTSSGRGVADEIASKSEYRPLLDRCDQMRVGLATMTGTELKELVYRIFPEEVGQLSMRERIEP